MFAVAPVKLRATQAAAERRGRIYDSYTLSVLALCNPPGRDVAEHHWRAVTPRTKGLQRERGRGDMTEIDGEERQLLPVFK